LENFLYVKLFTPRYQTSDGVSRQEEAEVKNLGTDFETLNVRGSVSYTAGIYYVYFLRTYIYSLINSSFAADGQKYTLNYIADENGYQPEGSHLPLSVFPIRS
jgi:Insect cuticle protein